MKWCIPDNNKDKCMNMLTTVKCFSNSSIIYTCIEPCNL